MSEINQLLTQITTHPKTAWLTVLCVNIAEWYVDWVSPVITALTSIGSFVIVVLLARYHWLNTSKLKLEILEAQKKLKTAQEVKNK